MITYLYPVEKSDVAVVVRLDGKIVGQIRKVTDGFAYFPKGQTTGGKVLPTVNAVKRTLEND
jgi:hypothetical protein